METRTSRFKKTCCGIVLTGMLFFSAEGFSEPLQVVTLNYPPLEYKEGDEIKGIAVDVIREVFKRMGQSIVIDVLPFPRALQNIQDGVSDVIFTFYHKKEREEFAYYSKEVLVDQTISLFVLDGSPVQFDGDISKLNKYNFGLVRFSYGEILDDAVKNNVITSVEYVSDLRLNLEKFVEKRFDIMPSDRLVAYYYYNDLVASNPGRSFPKIRELKPKVQNFPAYVGFSKKKNMLAIRDKFDATLAQMKKDGSYKRIVDARIADLKIQP